VIRDVQSRDDLAAPILDTDGRRFLSLKYAEAGRSEPLRLIRNLKAALRE
jgi:hypothetical protein